MGAFAQVAVVEEAHAAVMPASLDFATAAAIPLAGLTALQALRDELHVSSGQRLLISGGAGGVGSFAIQIAKHLGVQARKGAPLARSRERRPQQPHWQFNLSRRRGSLHSTTFR
jgi:alcohol dehydrogenase